MKVCILCILLVLALTSADVDSSRKVASIHQRIRAVPSAGGSAGKASENRPVPSLDRSISYHHRSRRVVNHVPSEDYGRLRGRQSTTPYPKHHLLQAIPVTLEDIQFEDELQISTTAPYTENHHSWKKSAVLFN